MIAIALFAVSLIELAAFLLRGVDINGAGGPHGSSGVAIQIGLSAIMLWILRHGAATIARAVALLLVFAGCFAKARMLLDGIGDGSNYLPLSVPIFLILVAAGLYEIARIGQGPRGG